jgi:hypothetical protein
MGFENSYERKLNHDRRAAKQQRAKQQSQVQIIHHELMDSPQRIAGQMFFLFSAFAENLPAGDPIPAAPY